MAIARAAAGIGRQLLQGLRPPVLNPLTGHPHLLPRRGNRHGHESSWHSPLTCRHFLERLLPLLDRATKGRYWRLRFRDTGQILPYLPQSATEGHA